METITARPGEELLEFLTYVASRSTHLNEDVQGDWMGTKFIVKPTYGQSGAYSAYKAAGGKQ